MLAIAGDVSAQQRSGLVAGLSVGGGVLALGGSSADPGVEIVRQDDGTQGAVAADVHLGLMIGPRFAVLFEGGGASVFDITSATSGQVTVGGRQVTFTSATSTLNSMVFVGAVQRWVTDRLWLRGGLGAGWLQRSLLVESEHLGITIEKGAGPAVLAAAGIEIWRRSNFALDVELHFTTFAHEGVRINTPTVQVGFQWY